MNVNWQYPKTEIDYLVLASLLWKDIADNGYENKKESKYWKYVWAMKSRCPCCDFYENCRSCPLGEGYRYCETIYQEWRSTCSFTGRKKAAQKIYDHLKQTIINLKLTREK
ncbi:MAG: hypothetical protein KAI70_00510 [Candidatus Omnitrophica bacterium]|nr:hypothetical protein [Candidatus Omnitrophota bacterium]